MEPLTVSALGATITALLNSTAGEAGKSAWAKLSSTAGRLFGSASEKAEVIAEVDRAALAPRSPGLPVAAERAADVLLTLARSDPDFAELLEAWHSDALATNNYSSTVHNTINGQVNGPAVQLHTNHGGINL